MADSGKSVFIIIPSLKEFRVIYETTVRAAANAGFRARQPANFLDPDLDVAQDLKSTIADVNLIVCDVTNSNPNVMYELGYAHALNKPSIIIGQSFETVPADLSGLDFIRYGTDPTDISDLHDRLVTSMIAANENPSILTKKEETRSKKNTVFISYNHKDEIFLRRLLVHLRPLEKAGLIEPWSDNRIQAGDRWKSKIQEALGRARAAILL